MRCTMLASLITGIVCLSSFTFAAEHAGWQGMRVIEQKGDPQRMVAADLDGSGRDQLIVVNPRDSRLDIYNWVPPAERQPVSRSDPRFPNDLPLAADWRRSELSIDEPPSDVLPLDFNGDGRLELLVLAVATSTNKLFLYEADDDNDWRLTHTWELLPGRASGGGDLMLLRKLPDGGRELLISLDQGIQRLPLERGSRPAWMSPRESKGRVDWRLLDLDGDGDLDLVEWTPQSQQAIRWYECVDGQLMPAQVLYDRSVQGMASLAVPDAPAELLLLAGQPRGVLRRYQLQRGEVTPVGRKEELPIAGGAKAIWCGIQLGDLPALVAVDPAQPRLRVYPLGPAGWQAEQVFPSIGNVRAIAAASGEPGKLLMWIKDAADLHTSQWESGRLTFPRAWPQSPDTADRRILALDTVGDVTWWVQRVADDLHLYLWKPRQSQPESLHFTGAGVKADKVLWLGGERLLVQQAYASGAKLLTLNKKTGAVHSEEPAHLAKVDLAEYGLYAWQGKLQPGRLTEGALQWLDEQLQPTDQIMLNDGARLAAFVPVAKNDAWALEAGGTFLHRMQPDDSGIVRVAETVRRGGGSVLRHDPLLGLILFDQERLARLSRGSPWELKLVDSIDSRVGRPSGVKQATIHRVGSTDVTGDGQDDVIVCDDARHQLSILVRGENELTPLISWQVFEDQAYPYGDEQRGEVSEPRVVIGFDADGDGRRDLAMLCHDRLLIYLAAEEP